MAMIDAILQELEQEAQTTKRILERVPQAHLGWKPHEKSMSLGQLALHIATVPGGVAQMAAQPSMQVPAFDQPAATHVSELVPALENSVKQAKAALGGMDDAAMAATWKVLDGDSRSDGHAAWRVPAVDHAEPLVSPSRSAGRVSETVERPGAVRLRADRRRESIRGAAGGCSDVMQDYGSRLKRSVPESTGISRNSAPSLTK